MAKEFVVYALRAPKAGGSCVLVEVLGKGAVAFLKENEETHRRVGAGFARDWVRRGRIHETALFVDEGRVRRAAPGV